MEALSHGLFKCLAVQQREETIDLGKVEVDERCYEIVVREDIFWMVWFAIWVCCNPLE